MSELSSPSALPRTGPAPGMGFVEAVRACFNRYVTFSGRASRSEFWWFILFTFVVGTVAGMIDGGNGLLSILVGLLIFLPQLAVTSRRFHDAGWSFWWYLMVLLPVLGWVFVLYVLVSKPEPTPNQFG